METRIPQIPLPNHNVIYHNGGEPIVEADQSIWKVYTLGVCTVLLALGFSVSLNLFIARGSAGYFFFAVGAGLFFIAFFLLSAILIKSPFINYGIIASEALALFIGSYSTFSLAAFFGALVALFLFLFAYYVAMREMESLLKIRFWRISKAVVPKVILGVALFISLVSYGKLGAADWTASEYSFISEKVFETVLTPAVPFAQKMVPEFDLRTALGDMIDRIAEREVANDARLAILSPSLRSDVSKATAAELRKQIEDYVGSPMDWNRSVVASLREAVLARLSGASPQAKSRIPAGIAVIVFLVIMSFTGIIRYLATFIAFLIYEMCMALGFSVLLLETRSREIIILK